MKFKIPYFFLPFLVAACLNAATQDEQPVNVNLRFSVVGWADEIEGLYYQDGDELKELNFRPFQRSEFYAYSGPPVLHLHEKHEADGDEATTTIVSSIDLPPQSENLNILIFPAGKGKYQSLAINENIDNFPPGHATVFNATPFDLAIRYNDAETKVIKRGKALLMKPDDGVLEYDIRYFEGERWLLASRNKVRIRNNIQYSIFVSASDANFFRSSAGSLSSKVNTFFLHREIK